MRKITGTAMALAVALTALAAAPAAADREGWIGKKVEVVRDLPCVVLPVDAHVSTFDFGDATPGTGKAVIGHKGVLGVCKAKGVKNDTGRRVWLNYANTGIECTGADIGMGGTKIWWQRINKNGNSRITCVWPTR